jgi:hypothetical protein
MNYTRIGNFLKLYPNDVDQIIVVGYVDESGFFKKSKFLMVSVLKLDHGNSNVIKACAQEIYIGFSDTPKDQNLLKVYREKVLPDRLPVTIFGAGYSINIIKEKSSLKQENVAAISFALRHIVKFIDDHSRNDFENAPQIAALDSKRVHDQLLVSLHLGFITYIYPDDPDQKTNPSKIGEATKGRLQIVTGAETSPLKMRGIGSMFPNQKCILKNCHSDEEW